MAYACRLCGSDPRVYIHSPPVAQGCGLFKGQEATTGEVKGLSEHATPPPLFRPERQCATATNNCFMVTIVVQQIHGPFGSVRNVVMQCSSGDRGLGFTLGDLKIALRGGGGTWTPAEGGGGVGEMGFCVGPFVWCKNGCWRRRCRNTKFWPEKVFSTNNPPPPTFE